MGTRADILLIIGIAGYGPGVRGDDLKGKAITS
jgi:hypothetical protein